MALSDQASAAVTDAHEQIAKLRQQVEALMNDRVTPMVADAAGRASSAMHTATGAVKDQAEAISGRVRDQPLIALLIAAGVGYVLGRISR